MAFDPLSDSTRKYRHGVITVASALIAVQIFQVKITEIPIGGIKIELKDRLIPVALIPVLIDQNLLAQSRSPMDMMRHG